MNEVVKEFQERMDEARECCTEIGDGMRNDGQVRWMFSKPGDSEKPGKFDFEGLHKLFSREEAEDNYTKAVSGENKEAIKQDLALAQVQSDILAGMERDFQKRRRSRVRMLAHESVARSVNGSPFGAIQGGLVSYIQAQIQRLKKVNNGSD